MKGDIPSPRSNHIAIAYKKNDAPDSSTQIFIHGGMNESGKLEDCYFLDAPEGKFQKIDIKGVGPSPRANHTAIVIDDKIYMFGGNGGNFSYVSLGGCLKGIYGRSGIYLDQIGFYY